MVSFADVLGGAERSLLSLALHLPSLGWAPVLACPPGPLADAVERAGLRVDRVRFRQAGAVSRRTKGRKRYSARAALALASATAANAWRIARLVRRHDPLLVHSNSFSSHLAAALAGLLVRRPVLWHLREIVEAGPGRLVFGLVGRLASGMVAISGAVAASVRHPRLVTVYNPVGEPTPGASPLWAVPRPVIGYLGRLDRQKGLEDLLVAAGSVDAHVVVVGKPWAATPAYVASLEQLAQAHAPGRAHFVGAVEDPWQALAGMDVLVVPSLAEPFGRVAAEGQRAGVPVLAADAGGLPEIVTHDHDGLLFAPADPASLAEQLARLLTDAELRTRLAAAGRASATRFDPARHAAAMAEVFRRHGRADDTRALPKPLPAPS